jgi:hypothetical protein
LDNEGKEFPFGNQIATCRKFVALGFLVKKNAWLPDLLIFTS